MSKLRATNSLSLSAVAALALVACGVPADGLEAEGSAYDDDAEGVAEDGGEAPLDKTAEIDIPAACARRGALTLTGRPGGSVCLFEKVTKRECVSPGFYWVGDLCLSPRLGRNPNMLYRPWSFKQGEFECRARGAKCTGLGLASFRCETPDQNVKDCNAHGGTYLKLTGPVVAGGPNVTVYKCELNVSYAWNHSP